MPTEHDAAMPTIAMTRWRLFLRGYLSLVAAIVLGVVISSPFIISRGRMYTENTYLLATLPPDEMQLTHWAESLDGITSFQTKRDDHSLWIRSDYRCFRETPTNRALVQKMRELGYTIQGIQGGSIGLASGPSEFMTDANTLAAMLVGMQVAFGIVALIQLRRASRRKAPVPPLFPGHHARSVAIGVAGGLLLIGIGELYSMGLIRLLGHSPPSPWDSCAVMPTSTKIVFLLFGGLGAPFAEEIFFRGFLFGSFKGAGHIVLGVVVSAVLFAGVHFSDCYNMPAICLYGVLLAAMYHYSGSLLTPIAAHCVNNGTAIAWLVLS